MTLPNKVDGNDAVLSIAETATPGVRLGTEVWRLREPNTIGDTGGDPTLKSRKPIGTRKLKRGSVVGIAPKISWNEDFTKTNFNWLCQGFAFSDMDEYFSSVPVNGSAIVFTSVATSDDSYNAAGGLNVGVIAKNLLWASGFTNAGNNGLKNVATVASGKITVSQNLTLEASPPAAARLDVVGVEFADADAVLTYAAPVLTLSTTAFDLTTLNLKGGDWVGLGADAAGNYFAASINGYARLASDPIATAMVFDKTTFVPSSQNGTGKSIRLWLPMLLKDVASADEVEHSYDVELQLGNDGSGIQSTHVEGCFANEITFNVPKKDAVTIDIGFIALNSHEIDGGEGIVAGTRSEIGVGEDQINTSSDVYRQRMTMIDPATLNPTPYFAYISTTTLKINNGIELDEAVGVLGGFDVSLGDFNVTGTVEAYFATVAAITAIRTKVPVTYDLILARDNSGFIFDMPLIELSGGLPKIERNKSIMLPINGQAVESDFGHCVWMGWFTYLPDALMPTV